MSAPLGWTPTSSTSGERARTAVAIPERSPPPPTPATIRRTFGRSVQDLEADRPLTGDDPRIVERGDQGEMFLPGDPDGLLVGLLIVGADQDDLGPHRLGRAHLEGRGGPGHHDGRRDLHRAGRPRDPLSVIPGRRGDHPTAGLLGRQVSEPVRRTAELERAGELKVLELEIDWYIWDPRERRGAHERGSSDLSRDQLCGALDIGERDRRTRRIGIDER